VSNLGKLTLVPPSEPPTVYLVEDDFADIGRCYRETDSSQADLETTITDLISGQYNDPVRVIAFNTFESWAADVSEDVAREIQRRFDVLYEDVPSHLQKFIDTHIGQELQLSLRLAV
jgi:hypothetical protein